MMAEKRKKTQIGKNVLCIIIVFKTVLPLSNTAAKIRLSELFVQKKPYSGIIIIFLVSEKSAALRV
jgi:hypothetical protein